MTKFSDLTVSPADAAASLRIMKALSYADNESRLELLRSLSVFGLQSSNIPTAFTRIKAKLDAGLSSSLLIHSDSTGVISSENRWPLRFAQAIAALYPTHSVRIRQWNDTNGNYDSFQVISAGTTSANFDIWLAAISGTVMQALLGSKFTAAIVAVPADGIIVNYGINYFPSWEIGSYGASVRGAMIAGIESLLLAHPDCPISITAQLPNRDNPATLANMPVYWKQIAQQYGLATIDVYNTYLGLAAPASFYNADGIHPNESGNLIWSRLVLDHFNYTPTNVAPRHTAHLTRKRPNLLINGDFSAWANTSIAPDSWTSTGTITFTRETSIVDYNRTHSVKMQSGAGAATYINQALSAGVRGLLAGQTVTLAVRNRRPQAAALTVGRIGLIVSGTGAETLNSVNGNSAVLPRDDFNWLIFAGQKMPDDLSALQVRLYGDSAAAPDTVNPCYWSEAWLGVGDFPYAAR